MANTYRFEAKNNRGEVVQGTLQAESESSVYQQLSGQGYYPLSISVVREKTTQKKKSSLANLIPASSQKKRVSPRELATFFDHLSLLLASGFPLLRSVDLTRRQVRNSTLANALEQISRDIQVGTKLSESLVNFPLIFPPAVSGAVQAGEATGKLDFIFQELAKAYEAEAELRAKITQALVYPGFVISFGILTVAFILTFIIPKLMVFFETWEHELPLPTRILLGASHLFSHGAGLGILGGLLALAVLMGRMERARRFALIAGAVRKLPLFNSLLFLGDFVPLVRTWSLMLKSGVPLLEALRIAENVVADPVMRTALRQASAQVNQGSTLTDALSETRLFPELALNFISVGEESGNLGQVCERVSVFYERELDQKLRVFTTLLEPVLILAVGLGIGFIVLSMLLPIFEINLMAQ